MAKVGLSSPWVIYYRQLEELFKKDPEVRVLYNEEENVVKLFVEEETKAEALTALLPTEKKFGSVTLFIKVIPANELKPKLSSNISLIEAAFHRNPIVSYIKTIRGIFTNNINYVVFLNQVVQYFNDDLGDVNGMCSTLYQDIAKRVFEPLDGIYFCTDVLPFDDDEIESLGCPLGEWP